MKNETRLNQRQHEECVPTAQTRQEGHVFPTPEDALRADRKATPLPPGVAHRIAATLAKDAQPPPASWWKRLFGS